MLKKTSINTDQLLPPILALCLSLLIGGMMMVLSISRYLAYNSGMYDLGNMSQAIWSVSQGQPLVFTFEDGQLSRLALHVEVIYLLIAPIYALFPSPVTLLVIQSSLYALGALPVYRLAQRKLNGRWSGLIFMLVYLLYPVMDTAVLFDFHGDSLAVPFILLALDALDIKSWKHYGVWVGVSLLCKFYVALPVAAMGAAIWLQGKRKAGFWTALSAAAWGAFAFFVVRSIFAPEGIVAEAQSTALGYLSFYFSSMLEGLKTGSLSRTIVAVIVFLPAIWLGFRSPSWLIPAGAVAIPALLSNGPGPSYYYGYHHYALAVPFLVMAILDGAAVMKAKQQIWLHGPEKERKKTLGWKVWVGVTLFVILALDAMFVNIPLNPGFWKTQRYDPNFYARTERDRFKDGWLERVVPDGAPISASPFMAAHLTQREILFLTDNPDADLNLVDYFIVDGLFDYASYFNGELSTGGVIYDLGAILTIMENPDFQWVDARDGLLLYQRDANPDEILYQSAQTQTLTSETVMDLGGGIGLIGCEIEPRGNYNYRVRCRWTAVETLEDQPLYLAVSRLEGPGDTRIARILHLPTLTSAQTTSWKEGEIIIEEFDVRLPQDLTAGNYEIWTSWYNTSDPYAAFTDERARVGLEIQIGTITVP